MPPLFLRAVSISALLCLTSAVSTATTPDEILNVVLQDIQALKEELADLKADNAQLLADNKALMAVIGVSNDRERRAAAPHRDDQALASPSQRKLTSSSSTQGSLLWSEGTFQFNSGSNFSGTVAAVGFQTKAPVSFVACATDDQSFSSGNGDQFRQPRIRPRWYLRHLEQYVHRALRWPLSIRWGHHGQR